LKTAYGGGSGARKAAVRNTSFRSASPMHATKSPTKEPKSESLGPMLLEPLGTAGATPGAPTSAKVRVQFVTAATACQFSNFCITAVQL
jgi:hypothetical protein